MTCAWCWAVAADQAVLACLPASLLRVCGQWLNNLRFQQCELDFSKLPELALSDPNTTSSTASPALGLGTGGGAAPVKHQQQHEQLPGLMLSRGGSSVAEEEDDVVVEEEEQQAGGAMGRALHPGRLAEAVATGAELIQQTGEMVVDGVLGAAQLLGVDRLPGIRRLLRGHVHQVRDGRAASAHPPPRPEGSSRAKGLRRACLLLLWWCAGLLGGLPACEESAVSGRVWRPAAASPWQQQQQ